MSAKKTEHGLSDTLKEGLFLRSTLAGKKPRGVDFSFLLKGDKGQQICSSTDGSKYIHSSANSHDGSIVSRYSRIRRAWGRGFSIFVHVLGVIFMLVFGGIVGWCIITPCPSL